MAGLVVATRNPGPLKAGECIIANSLTEFGSGTESRLAASLPFPKQGSTVRTAQPDAAILHIHDGWFNWGSAKAYRHLVGHIAAHAGVAAFVPDYRLAPEHPFPAAPADVRACYAGLVEIGYKKIAWPLADLKTQ